LSVMRDRTSDRWLTGAAENWYISVVRTTKTCGVLQRLSMDYIRTMHNLRVDNSVLMPHAVIRSLAGGTRIAVLAILFVLLGTSANSAVGSEPVATTTDSEQQQEHNTEWTTIELELIDRINAMGSKRIVLHAPEPARRLAEQLKSLMSSLGIGNIEVRCVDQVPDRPEVRYYHGSDTQAGNVVAEVLALVFDQVGARDFQDYHPAPAEGLIEIWLP